METNDKPLQAQPTDAAHANEQEDIHISVAPGIHVPRDSNIVGGGAPGEGVDIGAASGTSDSGGG